MKIQTTVIIVLVVSLASFGGIYISQFQHDDIKSNSIPVPSNVLNTVENTPVSVPTSPSVIDDVGYAGPITFHFIQNSVTLKVSPGNSVSGSIPINIIENVPMSFVIDDRESYVGSKILLSESIDPKTVVITMGKDSQSLKPITPNDLSVSMLIYGKQYQPEFISQEKPTFDKDHHPSDPIIGATSVSTKIGNTSVPYTISISKNIPLGNYSLIIDGRSFLPRLPITNSTAVYDESGNFHYEYVKIDQPGFMYGYAEEYEVILNVE